MKCKKCGKDTTKIIDGVPICKDCMLNDAAKNRGRVIDYSDLREPESARESEPETESNPPYPETVTAAAKSKPEKKSKNK
jgi:hypothetical protein